MTIIYSCHSKKEKDMEADDNVIAADEDSALKKQNILFQNWEIEDAEHPMKKDLFNNSDSIYNYPGLTFLSDSSIVENPRGEIRIGKFSLSGNNIIASFGKDRATYEIKKIEEYKMILSRNENNKTALLYLKGDGNPYYGRKINPFHPVYNQWRIKPSKPESDEEIRQRLKNCIQFFSIFFKDNYRRDATEIDFMGLPSCFKWYQGGISVQSEKNLDKKFITCFYNKEQALKARQMMDEVIVKKYHWQKEEQNWIKQTAGVLQQIRDSL